MSMCPVHNVEFKQIPAGVSKTTGKSYNSFMACPERGCREKPQTGYNSFQQVKQQYAPQEKPTKEYWEAKDARRQDSILLQVAFKETIALVVAGKIPMEAIQDQTLRFHAWLQSQTVAPKTEAQPAPEDDYAVDSIPF